VSEYDDIRAMRESHAECNRGGASGAWGQEAHRHRGLLLDMLETREKTLDEIAHALGVVYEMDGHASQRADDATILESIKALKHAKDERYDHVAAAVEQVRAALCGAAGDVDGPARAALLGVAERLGGVR